MDILCSECGSSNWSEILHVNYPERRQERNRTHKFVYTCRECGAEGRRFEHRHHGTEQLAGAMQ